jgi:rhodanese-related sulfurtransferase
MTRHSTLPLLFSLLAGLSLTACSDHDDKAKAETARVQVAQEVARHDDRVTADELARWIIQDKRDFVLVDIRSADDYAKGHIKDAINVSLPELVSPEKLKTLSKDRKVIVYSQGSETAAQATVLLRLAGLDANLLLGGYNFWAKRILDPAVPPSMADDEYPDAAVQQAIACYFVGGKAGAAPPPPKVVTPAFVPPVSTPAAPLPPAAHEGC